MAESEAQEHAPSEADELAELRLWRDQLLRPISVQGAFNLLDSAHKTELASQLWSGNYLSSLSGLREENLVLVEVLLSQISSTHDRRASDGHLMHKERLVDGVLINLVRAQSKFNMPLVSAALSVMASANLVPREFQTALGCATSSAVRLQWRVGSTI